MMTKSEKKNKAQHNYELAEFLINSERNCSDWVVTILFYSSIHYINFLMFPITIKSSSSNSKFCKNFDQAYSFYKNTSRSFKGQDRHTFRMELFKAVYGDGIGYFFQVLKTDCHTARYKKYSVDADYNDCQIAAKSLKSFCLNTKSIASLNLEKVSNL